MQRRDFFKITAATGALAALEGCGNPDHQLIRFIPEEDLVPGVATWKPSVCTLCQSGCGTLVRVMQGEAQVVRNGQLGLIKMGLAKKIEGNPAHPISQGKLCPRGQAALQVTYHPDRIKGPLALSGARASGEYQDISWDDGVKRLQAQLAPLASAKQKGGLVFLTEPLQGQRKTIVSKFAEAFGGSVIEFELFDRSVIEQANAQSFGVAAMPTVDLSQSNYVISFGADFLGTWNSPVAQSVGYGSMRRGRAGERGKFVQFESRMSQTGANADEWIACPPGMEGALALSLAHVILSEKLRAANAAAGAGIDGWSSGLADYAPEKIAAQAGIRAATITRIAREAAASAPAVVLIGDLATAQTNGLFAALAVNALNALLGSVGKPGGIEFSPNAVNGGSMATTATASASSAKASVRDLVQQIHSGAGPKVLLLYGANPVFATPAAWQVKEALEKVPFIAGFGSFVDETSILADLILPDSSALESWVDSLPESGTTRMVASVAPPAMSPIHDTKPMPDVLLEVAQQTGGDAAKALPWKTYQDALKTSFAQYANAKGGSVTGTSADDFWTKVQAAGGWWSTASEAAPVRAGKSGAPAKNSAPQFDGDAAQFPFHFLPFPSQMMYDGSLAHLPWMQEAPDPMSSAMWGSWVEINPANAQKLGIEQADLVEVASQHGTVRAPAMLSPAIAPDAVAMPVGQGHEHFTRFASGRGANPIAILAPLTTENGALAWGATRVKISKVGEGKLVLFGGSLREAEDQKQHR